MGGSSAVVLYAAHYADARNAVSDAGRIELHRSRL